MTNEELDAGGMIAFLAGVKSYYNRRRELTSVVDNALDQIIARLRAQFGTEDNANPQLVTIRETTNLATPVAAQDGERIEGWALAHEVNDPDDPYIHVYRSRTHPHLTDPLNEECGLSIIPVILHPKEPEIDE